MDVADEASKSKGNLDDDDDESEKKSSSAAAEQGDSDHMAPMMIEH